MAAVNNYIFSSAYAKLQYIAVSGGVFCAGKVEFRRGKLIFTKDSFEFSLDKLSEFVSLFKKLGENLTLQDTDSVGAEGGAVEPTKNDKSGSFASSNLTCGGEEKADEEKLIASGVEQKDLNAMSAGKGATATSAPQFQNATPKKENAEICIELSSEEEIELYKTALYLRKKNHETGVLLFDHFSYMSFLEKLANLFPFSLNPTPRQYDLIMKFQQHLLSSRTIVHQNDFVYPSLTKNMTSILNEVCQLTNMCRTEVFMQKQYIGLNLSSLSVFYELGRITNMYCDDTK